MEPLRLSAHAQWKGQPTREQQQLHYQWFADLGSTEAKRALGQMLTQGAHRDPVSALRYFRSAALRSTGQVSLPRLMLLDSGV